MLSHVVMFSFRNENDIEESLVRLRSLTGRIPSLRSIRCGRNSRQTPHSYDIVLISEHDSLAGLASYLEHPLHLELLEWLQPRITARAVVDTPKLA